MRRKLMAWIMSIMMIATMMPTMAFAEGESGGTTVSPAHTKTIKKNQDGTYTLKLDVKGAVSSTSAKAKVDVVIIADVSGSMAYKMDSETEGKPSRLSLLKTSAKSLTKALLENGGVDGRIALVQYSGSKGEYRYDDASVVTSWTGTKTTIDEGIDGLFAYGGTNCQAGLYEARTKVLNSARSDAQKIVIFMSDGVPTYYYDNSGYTKGAGSVDGDRVDYGGNVSNPGSCSKAAYEEAGNITDIDAFYSIGISSYSDKTFLKNLIQKPVSGKNITREYYSANDASALEKAFEDIAAQVTEFKYSKVSITDKLSQYVDIVGDDHPVLTVKVTDKNGNPVAGNEELTASYDSASKSVKLIFPERYTLKDGYTYSVEFNVKPSQEAEKYFDSNDSYPNTGDEGTDWDDNNRISAGQKGLYSNDNDGTELKYTYKEKDYTDKYPKPVIKVSPKTDISGTKKWVDDGDADGTRPKKITLKLYRNIKGEEKTEVRGVTPTWTPNGNTWTYEYKDLPKINKDGKVYTYTVKEDLPSDSPYEAKYDGNNITNSLKSGTTDFSGEKVWKDSDGKPIDNSKLPASIEIELIQNGVSIDKITVKPDVTTGKWTYTFTDLPKYDKDGKRYQYSTKEHIDGYISGIDTSTGKLTNTYNGGTTSYAVEKAWSDSENHPASVIIQLKQDGEAYGGKVTLNSANNWKHEFTNLPKYKKDGSKYKYSVEEDSVPGYESAQSELKDNDGNVIGTKITNTFANEKTKYTVTKEWSDPANHPGSVKIQLKQDGEAYGEKVTLDATNNWSHEYTNLPKYKKDGSKYKYSVEEDAVPGYGSAQSELKDNDGNVIGTKITNTFKDEKTTYEVEKKWSGVDADKTPDSVEVELTKDGNDTGTKATLTREGSWKYTFTGLDKYKKDGTLYEYGVKELTKFDGYTSEVKDNVITNTFKDEKTTYEVEKKWPGVDADKTPDSVEVELTKDGNDTGTKATLTREGSWKYTFTGLDKYKKDGTLYEYGVKELTKFDGYTSEVKDNVITNTFKDEKTTYEVEKKWPGVDADKTPDSVEVELTKDGNDTGTKATLTRDNGWKYKFTGLDKYNKKDGKLYRYGVKELTKFDGYTSEVKDNVITNTFKDEKTTYEVEKKWPGVDADKTPDSVEVELTKDGSDTGIKATLTREGGWKYTFTGLDKYNKKNGKLYKYGVKELTEFDGYTAEVKDNVITNTFKDEKTTYEVEKKWPGVDAEKTPDSVEVELTKDGNDTGIKATLTRENGWKYTFTGLDKYNKKNGKLYKYGVKELTEFDGYTAEVKDNVITNTFKDEKTTYKVEKKWPGVDADKTPGSIEVELLRDGTPTGTKATVKKSENWTYTFTDLPKYNTNGSKYTYGVKELSEFKGYSTVVEGNTITNTYNNELVSINGSKTWLPEGTTSLPKDVTVELYRNIKGSSSAPEKITETTIENFAYSFTDLPKYDTHGNEYEYTVKEKVPNGYEVSYDKEDPYHITNTYTGGDTEYSVEKNWAGVDKNDPLPAKVKVTLYQDGKATDQTAELTNGNDWNHVFKDLKKYRTDGTKYEYSVREEKIYGYTTEYGDNTVTNTYTGGDKVNVKGTKTWIDPEGTTHPTITIELYRSADGIDETFVKSTELADGITDYEFTDLEKYATNGSEYKYTVKEKTVDGYTTSYDKEKPNNITNTIKQEKIEVKGTKTWIDADGTDRPDVSVQLYRDGDKLGDPVKIDSDNKYEFTDLDKYDLTDGHIYRYTVRELCADGYITTIDGYDITNSKPIKTVKGANDKSEIKVGQELTYTISWTNASDEAVTATIKDTLTKGQEYVSGDEGAVVETKDGITTVKWENVAVAAGSKVEKTFTVKVTKDAEETVANTASIKVGDKPEISSNTTGVTPKIDISGEKIWKDKDDNFKLRPDSVKITLLANGEKTDKTTEATEASGWKYSFSDLPLYNDGKKIEYTVEETPVDNYLEPEYEVVNKDGNANKINIINSINEELFSWTGDITVDKAVAVKVDNEYAPQKVTDTFYFALFSDKELTKRATMKSEDGTETEIGIEKLELKNEASGTVTFKGVPTGTIKEPVKYYLAETDKDGVPVGEGFRYTPEFGQSGSEVSLTVKDHDADLKVANVFDNKIDVSGKKTWVDDNDKHKQRPDDITVFLKQNGEDYRDAQENTYAVHASKDTDWAYTFKDLPEFDENGDRYEYSVDEAFVAYYDAVIDGMDITNTFDKKKYYDDNPATITVTKETLLKGKEYEVNDIYYAGVFVDKDHTTLLADEEGAYIIPLVLENESSASFEFKVPYHEDGTATYYITEVTKDGTPVDKVSGLKYKASVKGGKVTVSAEDSVASVTFTNSYEQPKVPKTGDSGLPLIWMLIGLMAAALAAAAWIIFGRRETRRL